MNRQQQPSIRRIVCAEARHGAARRLRVADFRADAIAGLHGGNCRTCRCRWRSRSRPVSSPGRGLYTAVMGGFLVSLLGGTRFQVGGRRRFHRAGGVDRRPSRLDRVILADHDGRRVSDCRGLSAARYLHQIHSLSGDGGFTAGIAADQFASQLKDLGITLRAGSRRIAFEAGVWRGVSPPTFSRSRGGRQHPIIVGLAEDCAGTGPAS